ncbi:peroxiredoxin, SACOL1771 subfamily [Microbulbifer donghaiensis]|uniref:Peroxiredoxin, SACOL1771 subfamily n=1 Tax=Microbulbifer donghaiensis TaxID=494016 RepID=A0A1M5HH43_9GAMM|nr:OsmC family protein [Microbulbifer donghaiensis]SHG15294.1 peroxiredoxin, SACOL1771 subfamily [Microbulbifer donghaiensis]
MQKFPHHYKVSAAAGPDGDVRVSAEGLDVIPSAAPTQFGGPGDRWSPEDLLVAAVADCFVLTFRAIADYSKFAWKSLECDVEGVLDKVDGKTRFTHFTVHANLELEPGSDEAKAGQLLEKSEAACLVTNSLSAQVELTSTIRGA